MTDAVRKLFAEVADLDPAARQRLYQERNTPDSIRDEVESLLAFDRRDESLTAAVSSVAADFANAEGVTEGGLPSHPSSIGPFAIQGVLGRGGMGVVYLARRTDGDLSRQVALKILYSGFSGTSIQRRFLQERQILASLQHPGIAQMIDAGRTQTGEPYLVMEYVAGVPLDQFCSAKTLPEIIRLFIRICETLSFAHRNLVIHRDLKPSNILVDETGQPKLLDFGIAKIVDDSSITQTVDRVLTPEFASPEQLRGNPQTVATDVFSLGAVLNKVASESFSSGEQSKDLRAIVRMAMREQPEGRYSSVDAFAADLRALLEFRVVQARRGTVGYAVRRFVRRHWVGVAAAIVTTSALVTGTLVANRERTVAQRRFNEVRQLANELFDLDGEISRIPGSTQARHKLVSTSLAYLERLRPDALQDNSLALEIGSGYLRVARAQGVPAAPNLGQAEEADRSLVKADELLALVRKADPQNRRALLISMQIAHDRMILADVGRRDAEAKILAREAMLHAERLIAGAAQGPDETEAIVATLANVSLALSNMDEWAEGAANAQRCAEYARKAAPRTPAGVACQSTLANALRQLGRLDEALVAIDTAREMIPEAEFAGVTTQMSNKYAVLWRRGVILGEADAPSLGRDREAIASLRQAFDIMEDLARRDPAESSSRIRLATAGREMAEILVKTDPKGSLAVREHCLRRLAEVAKGSAARYGEVWHLAGSAECLRRLGRNPEAEQALTHAFDALRKLRAYPVATGPVQSEVQFALRMQAEHLAATGRRAAAVKVLEEALRLDSSAESVLRERLPDAFRVSSLWCRLSEWNARLGNAKEALEYQRKVSALWGQWSAKLPDNKFVTAQSRRFSAMSGANH